MLLLANIEIFLFPVQIPLMLGALIPVILVESLVVRWKLSLTWKDNFVGNAAGNFVSTLAGVPFAYILMFLLLFIESFVGREFWSSKEQSPVIMLAYILLRSSEGFFHDPIYLEWMVPMALVILMIPSYFLSVWIEYLVCSRIWKQLPRRVVWQTMRISNGASYGMIIVICIILILLNCIFGNSFGDVLRHYYPTFIIKS